MCLGCLIQGVLFCHVAVHHRFHGSITAYEACVHREFKSAILYVLLFALFHTKVLKRGCPA